MIGGSEKRNCEGGFELQPPLVFEKRSNPQKREFSLLLNIPRSRYSVSGYNRTATRTNINVSLNTGPGAERGRKKRGKKGRPSHSLCTDPPPPNFFLREGGSVHRQAFPTLLSIVVKTICERSRSILLMRVTFFLLIMY